MFFEAIDRALRETPPTGKAAKDRDAIAFRKHALVIHAHYMARSSASASVFKLEEQVQI